MSITSVLVQIFGSNLLRTEALFVFISDDKSLDHFSSDEVAAKLIQLGQPKIVAAVYLCKRGSAIQNREQWRLAADPT